METLIAKLKNFWYYYKIPVGIGLCILVAAVWLNVQSAGSIEADYHIGLVGQMRPEEQVAAMEETFAAHGTDRNGDGRVTVTVRTYAVKLGDTSDNAGYSDYEIIAALDADLIGGVSGLFLLEDPEAFQNAANGLLAQPYLAYEDGLYLCIRSDAEEVYQKLFEAMK